MVKLKASLVEKEMTKLLDDVKTKIGIEATINTNTCPNTLGIASLILVTITSRLEDILKVVIPEDCYLFYNKKLQKHLTIKEATHKLMQNYS